MVSKLKLLNIKLLEKAGKVRYEDIMEILKDINDELKISFQRNYSRSMD